MDHNANPSDNNKVYTLSVGETVTIQLKGISEHDSWGIEEQPDPTIIKFTDESETSTGSQHTWKAQALHAGQTHAVVWGTFERPVVNHYTLTFNVQ